MASSISLRYSVTPRDFLTGAEALWIAQKQGTRRSLVFAGWFLIFGLLTLSLQTWVGGLLLALAGLMAAATALRRGMWRRAFRNNPHATDEIQARLAESGLELETHHGASRLGWDTFQGFVDHPEVLVLIVSPKNFAVLPKRNLSAEECARLVSLVSAQLPPFPPSGARGAEDRSAPSTHST